MELTSSHLQFLPLLPSAKLLLTLLYLLSTFDMFEMALDPTITLIQTFDSYVFAFSFIDRIQLHPEYLLSDTKAFT
jgi:hypothetical protein